MQLLLTAYESESEFFLFFKKWKSEMFQAHGAKMEKKSSLV